ncbi:MAG: cytochrome-c peroxidase [Saprospiraceae bacterium]
MRSIQILFFVSLLFAFSSCQKDDATNTDTNITDINEVDPNGNNGNNGNGNGNNTGGTGTANNNSMVTLGRLLFWDPILSGEKDVACATCHHPDFGYSDGRALPIGVGGEGLGPSRIDAVNDDIGIVRRNSPTIINTNFNGISTNGNFDPAQAPMFWDNRLRSLEAQALGPLLSFEEMRGHSFNENVTLDSIVNRLSNIGQYNTLFTAAFGTNNSITSTNIGAAIAAFERTIIATDSPFDQFQAGNQNALTQAQIRGMDRFQDIGCDDCHSGPMFSDFELHVVGVPDNNLLATSDAGANGTYSFRTPTLRNLNETGPYFHNGVGGNLQQTIQFYITARNFARGNGNGGGGGGNSGGGGNGGGLNVNPNVNQNDIDNDVRNLQNFNNNDIQDIIAFIQALDDPGFDRTIPATVPSGLNPGGNID